MAQTKTNFATLHINLNSRIYFLDIDQKLYEIFKYNLQDQNYVQQEIGFINSTDFINSVNYIWDRRSNLSRIHLNIIYVDYHPFNIKQNDTSKVKGYNGEIFHSLQEKLNFNYNLNIQADKLYGQPDNKGIFTGMFGNIQRGHYNWSIADCSESEERALAFDFSIPVLNAPKRIITQRPSEEFDTSSYFVVFSPQFWVCLFISAVALIFFMYWILRFVLQVSSDVLGSTMKQLITLYYKMQKLSKLAMQGIHLNMNLSISYCFRKIEYILLEKMTSILNMCSNPWVWQWT